jgi:DNA-binding NarL/FixJ family response regulator
MEVRIFLVEDLPGMRSLLQGLFATLGGIRLVDAAATEAEAKLWLDHHVGGWDVALIDLVLDQGSGLGLIRHCKATTPTGKVAVFSSYASPGIVKHCLAIGADAVFDKSDTKGFIAWLHAQSAGRPAP